MCLVCFSHLIIICPITPDVHWFRCFLQDSSTMKFIYFIFSKCLVWFTEKMCINHQGKSGKSHFFLFLFTYFLLVVFFGKWTLSPLFIRDIGFSSGGCNWSSLVLVSFRYTPYSCNRHILLYHFFVFSEKFTRISLLMYAHLSNLWNKAQLKW